MTPGTRGITSYSCSPTSFSSFSYDEHDYISNAKRYIENQCQKGGQPLPIAEIEEISVKNRNSASTTNQMSLPALITYCHDYQPEELLSSKIQSLCPMITGNVCCTEAQFDTLLTQVQQVPVYKEPTLVIPGTPGIV
ncbi:hypothetical protein CIPAW_06G075800 [Carya illinoinensis]|uniref:Uncharacterized protein n=1 Tax=Carya illinoinensis TaxID=32201 RepID=A0A8T1Q953_CARIL|nr:hypothetical protein CIPAW_06G075800 [Carya illinoinensis]KAG6650914.1 hypothetical protein CIPAW_06G075800 [Carya illinoinensis]